MSPQKCAHCGAHAKVHSARFCEYCGTELPLPPPPHSSTRASGDPTPGLPPLDRLAALEASPALQSALLENPAFDRVTRGFRTTSVLFLIVWCGACFFIALAAAAIFPPLALVPIAMGALGVWSTFASVRRVARFQRAPVVPVPSIVLAERTQVTGGDDDSQGTTDYFLAVQTREGRRELRVQAGLFGQVAPGDAGLAYLKDGRMVAFRAIAL